MTGPVPAGLAGERLDRVVAVMAGVSRAEARRLIESGAVTVDGVAAVAPARRLERGAVLYIPPVPAPAEPPGEAVQFTVAWEDEHLAVIDKPPGVVTHPGAGNASGTLSSGILHRWPQLSIVGEPGRRGIVHRLDKGTSGLLVIAKTAPAEAGLRSLIKAHLVERTYLALVQTPMMIETGTIDAPIDRDPGRPVRRRVHPAGRPARTHYEQLAAWQEHGLLRVELETGRTHQIRVHLAAIEHPVVGDRTYGAGSDPADPGRVWLHSWKLAFGHPITGEDIACRAPLPDDLTASLTLLGQPESGSVPEEISR